MLVCAFLTATPALTPLLKPAMAAAADTAAAEAAATCLSAITRADGCLAKRRVEVGSGDRAADRRAPAHLDMLDRSRSIRDFEPERQSGYIVVCGLRRTRSRRASAISAACMPRARPPARQRAERTEAAATHGWRPCPRAGPPAHGSRSSAAAKTAARSAVAAC
jgi:hypothetical protein